ncbi:DUF3131 domain-containing protein [Cribrihabitans neustonicus]|uniref:DUF3131 domain-containing protein n=1 Tax=Cribrihabitans neustonicus TaxID=1429085 RepID=UPI003B5A13B7
MKRRSFLKSAAASMSVFPASGMASVLPSPVAQAYPVLTGITEDVSVPHLIAVLDAFIDRNLPLTCVVSPFGRDGKPLAPGSKLAQVLNGYQLGNSGLEIAAFVPDLPVLSEHFQARAAFEAVQAVQNTLRTSIAAGKSGPAVKTLACAEAAIPMSPRGVRSAGVFNVLVIPARSGSVRSETWDNGVVRLFGGSLISLSGLAAPTHGTDPQATQNLYYLPAGDFSKYPVAQLKRAVNHFASTLEEKEVDGEHSLLSVSDVQLRDDYRFSQSLCLHLLRPLPEEAARMGAFSAFAGFLAKEGIAYTAGPDVAAANGPGADGYWIPMDMLPAPEASRSGPAGMSAIGVDFPGAADRPEIKTVMPLGPGIGVLFSADSTGPQGLSHNGFLHLPRHVISAGRPVASLQQVLHGTGDRIVFVEADALLFPPERKALEAMLKELHAGSTVEFIPLDQYTRRIAPAGPIPKRYRRAAAAAPGLSKARTPLSQKMRAELLDDARVAWRYFENFTDPGTGLCPATVNFAPGGRQHKAVTMWDVGSQINGLIAASQIGLISRNSLESAIHRILPNIAGRTSQQRHLPQGWIRTDRHKWGNRDFDGSDAGRLLAALDNLRRHSRAGDQLAELVGAWDLEKVIIGGEIFSVKDGVLKTSFVSHSAHYSALAFRRWGLSVKSPYEVFSQRSVPDGQMALLEAAARIGPIGAEPLLLEAMELGMSAESAFLADVLFSAQLEEYGETGRLICVSEGPVDRSPWFFYQGLQLDAGSRTWAIDTVGQEPEYRTPAFREANLVFSTKAAYLWSAYQPHDYSRKLLRFARDKARTENGFCSSIYLKSGEPTSAYTDLNTNGVILQAIAHHLTNAG